MVKLGIAYYSTNITWDSSGGFVQLTYLGDFIYLGISSGWIWSWPHYVPSLEWSFTYGKFIPKWLNLRNLVTCQDTTRKPWRGSRGPARPVGGIHQPCRMCMCHDTQTVHCEIPAHWRWLAAIPGWGSSIQERDACGLWLCEGCWSTVARRGSRHQKVCGIQCLAVVPDCIGLVNYCSLATTFGVKQQLWLKLALL